MNTPEHPTPQTLTRLHERVKHYLETSLLPFWMKNAPDPPFGGFLSYFDINGQPTGENVKTFLMQIRLLYTFSAAARAGFGGEHCPRLAAEAANFLRCHYRDAEHGGWYWIADRHGRPTVRDKVGYGQCFAIYAFSEYYLASGDNSARDTALDTFSAVMQHMADTRYGGFYELMSHDWQPAPGGSGGGDRKSFDVHMHMMEALTSLCMVTAHPTHARRLREVVDLITSRMLHPDTGLGYYQFARDFTPLPAIEFNTAWGRDAKPMNGARPLDHTSPGHNVEFAWLLLRAADALGEPKTRYAETVRRLCDHCVQYGIDNEPGGVYAETPMNRPTNLTEKQFWQQAEAMVGMLAAYELLGNPVYWNAFLNVYHFVFEKLVVMPAGGEWIERVDRTGRPIDPVLGHAWKISYHTVRSMIEVQQRLKRLAQKPGEP